MNSEDKSGSTALVEAVERGFTECVKSLVQSGADVNVDKSGTTTPLESSVAMNDLNTADFLIQSGADVNIVTHRGTTPLMRAGSRECIAFLLKAGADVNLTNECGETALYSAALSKHSLIEPLLEAGADVGTCTTEYGSVVTVVSCSGSARTLGLLITAGADVNAVNDEKETPLIVAAKYNEQHGCECIKLLLKSGAKIDQVEFGGFNALHSHISSSYDTWESGLPDDDICMLLFAAGESLDGPNTLPDCLSFDNLGFCLKHLCRETIRKHLRFTDTEDANLFNLVPELGLPSLLTNYLLYNVSLDLDDDDVDDHGNDI